MKAASRAVWSSAGGNTRMRRGGDRGQQRECRDGAEQTAESVAAMVELSQAGGRRRGPEAARGAYGHRARMPGRRKPGPDRHDTSSARYQASPGCVRVPCVIWSD